MARGSVRVGRIPADDETAIDHFAGLWTQASVAAGHSDEWAERTVRDGALRAAIARDDVRVYLATSNDEPTGFAVVLDGPQPSLAEQPAVWIEQLYVVERCRRSGISKALLGRIAHDAESSGAGQLVSCVPSQARDINRYFARLGFAPTITERTISPSSLLRHLAGDDKDSLVREVVRRRRSVRARARARLGVAHSGS